MTAGSLAMRYHVGPHAVSTSMHVRTHQDNAESSIRGYQLVIHCTVGSLQVDERSRLGEQREEVRVVSSLLASVLGSIKQGTVRSKMDQEGNVECNLLVVSLFTPSLIKTIMTQHAHHIWRYV